MGRRARCWLGMAGIVLGVLACGSAQPERASPPNVLLVVLDTARGDHFSLYGHDRETSPRLASFARDAIVFDRAYATSCWTVASHGSLFTGMLPVTHGATQEKLRLDDELVTLAELLKDRGYRTVAFSNNSWISGLTRLTQGFEDVSPLWREKTLPGASPHPTNAAALDWLRGRDPAKPFFVFVNYIEPHWPFEAPREHEARFLGADVDERLRKRSGFPAVSWYLGRGAGRPALLDVRARMYDAEIAYVDEVLGDLLDGIAALGLLDDTLVVVTADHGENLGENGHLGHSFSLYDATLRIPLVIRVPGGEGGGSRRSDPVQLPDVFVTIAHAAGIDVLDPRVIGADLLAGPVPEDRPIVAEYYYPEMFLRRFPEKAGTGPRLAPYRRRIRSIQIGNDKLIWGSDGKHELYDIAADPGEQTDRIASAPETAAALTETLEAFVSRLARDSEGSSLLEGIDAETEENLRALGYIP